jgi:hypothetical protein
MPPLLEVPVPELPFMPPDGSLPVGDWVEEPPGVGLEGELGEPYEPVVDCANALPTNADASATAMREVFMRCFLGEGL